MLPLLIYEILPYCYLSVAALVFVWFNHELIVISSILMTTAGFVVLWMRIDNRRTNTEIVSGDIDYISNPDRYSNQERTNQTVAGN